MSAIGAPAGYERYWQHSSCSEHAELPGIQLLIPAFAVEARDEAAALKSITQNGCPDLWRWSIALSVQRTLGPYGRRLGHA